MMRPVFVVLLAGTLLHAGHTQTFEVRADFGQYFDSCHVSGSFSLYDPAVDRYVLYNPDQFRMPFTPASTFKICNSLIGLETGVIADAHFVIPWDGVKRSYPKWNADQDLQTAYKNSTVPYYQELARRVGSTRMKFWLDKAGYGNADTSGGLDQFWLRGGLRISPEQQLQFLVRLYRNELPFSRRTIDIVKKIMIEDSSARGILRTKTGWGNQGNVNIGWYVGYLVRENHALFFATCIQSETENINFAACRKTITMKILRNLGIFGIEASK